MELKHMHFPQGIDVSDNNGEFDWSAWNGHIEFAMIKATEGPFDEYPEGLTDTQFSRNWHEAKAIGVKRFAYHFLHPDHDPAEQAKQFVKAVEDEGLTSDDGLVLDFETYDSAGSEYTVRVAFNAWVFCKEVERLRPANRLLVYTYPAFAEMGFCALLTHWPLWLADWNVASPAIPVPWRSWTFWQYAQGRLGTPDLDRFHGTEKDLESFLR
jgi:lysozyme